MGIRIGPVKGRVRSGTGARGLVPYRKTRR